MADKETFDNERWLKTLASSSAQIDARDESLDAEALQLQRALQSRAVKLDEGVPTADRGLFARLERSLETEGLTFATSAPWWRRFLVQIGSPGDSVTVLGGVGARWKSVPVIASVAVIAAVIAVMTLMRPQGRSVDAGFLTTRGAQVLIVDDLEQKKNELIRGFEAAGETPNVAPLKDGGISLEVRATEKVLEFLADQRILPKVENGRLVLVLQAK